MEKLLFWFTLCALITFYPLDNTIYLLIRKNIWVLDRFGRKNQVLLGFILLEYGNTEYTIVMLLQRFSQKIMLNTLRHSLYSFSCLIFHSRESHNWNLKCK